MKIDKYCKMLKQSNSINFNLTSFFADLHAEAASSGLREMLD